MVEKGPQEVLEAKIQKLNSLLGELAKTREAIQLTMASLEEAKRVLREIEKLPDDAKLYKTVGFVLVPVDKQSLIKELNDKISELDLRLKKLTKIEESLSEEIRRLQLEIRSLAGSAGKPEGGAPVGG